jgi:isohexenylglutaconyl-CoA hydratase
MTELINNFETLTLTLTLPFAQITLNRPEVKNAMNAQMVLDITAAFAALKDNREVRAVVLSGAGGSFCVGGDIKELAAAFQDDNPMNENLGAVDAMLRAVNQAPQVVIAKIEGAAMGGGLGLVCVSDIAVASTDAKLGLPEVRMGLVPALISPFVIQRIGLTRARQLMLTGRRLSSEEAQQYGIVQEVCPPGELDAKVGSILEEIHLCSPNALAACKALIFEVMGKDLNSTVDYRATLLTELRRSEEAQEGMMAFMQKRPAKWAEKD